MMVRHLASMGLVAAAMAVVAFGGDADWPQWRGPNRDGHAASQTLMQSWPEEGPELVFQFDHAGGGYSAMSVVDGRMYTLGADQGDAFALCIDVASGREVWRTVFSATGGESDYNTRWGDGTRSTPTVDGQDVFVLSDVGIVAAMDRSTGRVRWKVDLVRDHGGSIPMWGYSESVLIDGDRVMCTPGGSNFMVGLDRRTGEKVWSSVGVDAPAQYASIVRGMAGGGVPYYATASKTGLIGLKISDGSSLFQEPATGNRVAVVTTPVVFPGGIYHTSAYYGGCARLKFEGETAELAYHLTDKTMHNHHGGVVLVDGVIYGFTKNSGGAWMAQDLDSGQTLWRERLRPNKSGSIAYADGRLYCYNDKDGVCYLVRPNRERFDPVGKVTLPRQTDRPRRLGAIWAHPVIADGVLFIRDQELIFGFDVGG